MQRGTRLANRLYNCYGIPTTSRDLLALDQRFQGTSQEKVVLGDKRDRGTFRARGDAARVAVNYELGFSTKKLVSNFVCNFANRINSK